MRYLVAAAMLMALAPAAAHAKPDGKAIAAAVADAARPSEDVAADANRKPAAMLEFAEVKPGQKVADLLPGRGYFSRLFAKTVGDKGKVFPVTPPGRDGAPPAIKSVAAGYPNMTVVDVTMATIAQLKLPEPVDLVWTSQNYHDLHAARNNVDVAAFNKAVFAALKPGGLFVVLDHVAPGGTALDPDDKLHRIDPAIVKAEVTAAGFVYDGESTVLRNPDDKHDLTVFDPAIRGRTDQFVYKFRKPK
ncbi:MAG: class I SAM-dependent methyltransferase [Hyphomonadaceae bacterium]